MYSFIKDRSQNTVRILKYYLLLEIGRIDSISLNSAIRPLYLDPVWQILLVHVLFTGSMSHSVVSNLPVRMHAKKETCRYLEQGWVYIRIHVQETWESKHYWNLSYLRALDWILP
jgi:hypothetical protein